MADIEIHSEEDFEADEEGDSKWRIFLLLSVILILVKFTRATPNRYFDLLVWKLLFSVRGRERLSD